MSSADLQNSYESFNNVLQTFSNNGTVDYTSLRTDPFNLEKFITFINNVSPASHPGLFSESDEKAYWINVYNALAIKTIIDNPDVSSIREISWGMGAFWRNKFVVGGKKMTLNHIEHKILRKKYQDPRIHFAINCASNSCPPIGNRIVTGGNLDEQLDLKTYNFINDPSNVRIDHTKKEVHLSRIFKWYKKDFTKKHEDLLSYIFGFMDDISINQDAEIVKTYQIIYNKYDWSLNE
ncbi:MAG: DUF547 domain-containing protein [Candidatus Neomarinimicrobiota bacterium]